MATLYRVGTVYITCCCNDAPPEQPDAQWPITDEQAADIVAGAEIRVTDGNVEVVPQVIPTIPDNALGVPITWYSIAPGVWVDGLTGEVHIGGTTYRAI